MKAIVIAALVLAGCNSAPPPKPEATPSPFDTRTIVITEHSTLVRNKRCACYTVKRTYTVDSEYLPPGVVYVSACGGTACPSPTPQPAWAARIYGSPQSALDGFLAANPAPTP